MEYRINKTQEVGRSKLEAGFKIFVCAAFSILTSSFYLPTSTHAATIGAPMNYLGGGSLAQGLVGYWTFDGAKMAQNAADSSSNNFNGFLQAFTSTSSAVIQGKIGQALTFNGTTQYVQSANVPNTSFISSDEQSHSIFAWVRPNTASTLVDSTVHTIVEYGEFTTTDFSTGLVLLNGTLRWAADSGGDEYQDSALQVPPNQWSYVGMVSKSNGAGAPTITFYVNGVSNTVTGVEFGHVVSTGPILIGTEVGNAGSPKNFFGGTIDDLHVYNRTLSAAEINRLYLQGQAIVGAPSGGASKGCAISSLNCGLVGYWTFNSQDTNWVTGKTKDTSGNGNDGQLINMSTSTNPVSGKIGQGLSFNGITNFVQVNRTGSLEPANITVSAWVQFLSTKSGLIVTKEHSASNFAFSLDHHVTSGGSNVAFCVTATCANLLAGDTGLIGKWVFLTGIYDGTNVSIYLNGVFQASTPSSAIDYAGANPLFIGGEVGPANISNMQLDDVRIYNRALTAAEVHQLYMQSQPSLIAAPQGGASKGCGLSSLNCGLVGYWTFNSQDTNWATGKTKDASGQGNDGQLINMSTTTSPTYGKLGQAMNFSLSNQSYIDAGDPTNLRLSGSFTLSAWEKLPSTFPNGIRQEVISKAESDDNDNYLFGTSNNSGFCSPPVNIYLDFNDSLGGDNIVCSSRAITLNTWHHMVATWDSVSKTSTLYIDGTFESSQTFAVVPVSGSGKDVMIGQESCCGNGNNFDGSLDDVRIYNRALTATEVKQLYLQGK